MGKRTNELKPIDSPVYGYWSALIRSFYSRELYVDVGKRWKKFGLLYLLLAIMLLSIPFYIRMAIDLNQSFREQITEPLSKIPTFYVLNGKVIFDQPMPYFIYNEKQQVVVIIDTTGKVNDFSDAHPYLSILINKDKLSFKIPEPQLFILNEAATPGSTGKPMVQKLSENTNFVFNGQKMVEQNSVQGLKYSTQVILYPIIVTIMFSFFAVILLVIAALGQIFALTFFSMKIDFASSSRLMMVAATPMLFLFFGLMASNRLFTGTGAVLFILLTVYYCFAIFSLKAESRKVVKL